MAVYTEVEPAALAALLADYELGRPIACRGIAEGVENSNFALRTERGDFVLTLYERRVEAADLPYFLGLMRHLSDRGLSCPRPVAARDGAVLRHVAGRPAAICTFLPGDWPREILLAHMPPLGAALAALHAAGTGFALRRANALGPAGWPALLDRCRTVAGDADAALLTELDGALAAILSAWPRAGALVTGHIHADLFPDNVFFLATEGAPRVSGLIDFYFACTDLLAYDLAVCINAWCFDPAGNFVTDRAAALMSAYAVARPLTEEERAALPVLCRGAALRFLLTRLHDWHATPPGALVTRKDPNEYLRKLRFFTGIDRLDL